jgi:DNA-binding transcriptional regulator YiaG
MRDASTAETTPEVPPEPSSEKSTTVYARIVADIRTSALTSAELAEITGVRERQVYNWAKGANRPEGSSRDILLEVHYIVEQLKEVYTPEGVEIWIHGRNRDLDSQRPIDLLKQGEFELVLDVIEQLQAGGM